MSQYFEDILIYINSADLSKCIALWLRKIALRKVIYINVASRVINVAAAWQLQMIHSCRERDSRRSRCTLSHSLTHEHISTIYVALFRIYFNIRPYIQPINIGVGARDFGLAWRESDREKRSGSPRFQPVVKLGTLGMDLLWGWTRVLERCSMLPDGRMDKSRERASVRRHS